MPTPSKAGASSTITPEIWFEIFQIATFIPNEWDVAASRIDMGTFCSSKFQGEAYYSVLPLRRSIVEVCRLWHKIGTKLLYASFHCAHLDSEESIYRLAGFAHVLLARPDLGRLVKRLSLRWSPTITDNELIIHHCPNAIIFSSFLKRASSFSSTWVRYLPESLRGLEANVDGMSMSEIMKILFTLPNLELLYMYELGKEESPLQYPGLRFPALRLLTLKFSSLKAIKTWVPVLSRLNAPKLTAFKTDMGVLSSAVSSFPRGIWEGITSFELIFKGYRYIQPPYLLNLRHLILPIMVDQVLPKLQKHFPFHQLETLTLSLEDLHTIDVKEWRPFIRQLLAFPLDTQKMPSLRVLELDWTLRNLEASVKCEISHREVLTEFLTTLSELAVQLEKRGVRFLEVQRLVVYHTPALIQGVVADCKKYVLESR